MVINDSLIPRIEAKYETLTKTEKEVADYFINKYKQGDSLNASELAKKLFVSEATLTRFAKKIDFTGYREFSFAIQQTLETERPELASSKWIINDYQEVLIKTYNLLDMEQLERIASFIISHKRTYFYGKGSSGIAAQEMKIRLMRLGVVCEVITDDHLMQINQVLLDPTCLVIGLSLSGKTEVVISALNSAKAKGATTCIITQSDNPNFNTFDEMVPVASLKNLDYGNLISPQIPLLLVIDIIYDLYRKLNHIESTESFDLTIIALNRKEEMDE